MAGIARWTLLSMMLLSAVSIPARGAHAGTQGGRLVPWRVERDILRFRAIATDNVMKLLAITPGMTILDIGAGTGQFAYEFAGRLDKTGGIYATDTNESCIEHITKEAARRNLRNLHPILVRKEGVDPFYGKYKFNLITAFHLSIAYEDQAAYLRELRGSLAEGGRLVLILYKIPAAFSPDDFTEDFRGLVREMSLEPEESPYSMLLKDSTRKRIRYVPGQDPPEELKDAIAEEFNHALADTRFSSSFSGESTFRIKADFFPEERRYVDWLLLPFRDSRARNKEIRIESTSGIRVVATINKLLIVQRYRKYLKKSGLFLSGFTPSVRAAFEKAGYRVEREYPDLIPFEDMIVLSSREQGERRAPKESPAP